MDRALFAAASGMAAQQRNLDTIADNLANAGVVGFKGSAQSFAELIAPGQGGLGTVALGARMLFAQGKLARSPGPFDLAIDGPGFFTLVDAHGHRYYTRDGAVLARRRRNAAQRARFTFGRSAHSRRRALRHGRSRRQRSCDVCKRRARHRTDPRGRVCRSRTAARDRRRALRSDAGIGQGCARFGRAATTVRSCASACSRNRTSRSSTR